MDLFFYHLLKVKGILMDFIRFIFFYNVLVARADTSHNPEVNQNL